LAVTEYRDIGYLPEALLNMVAMVGWNPGTEQELFIKDELIKIFELSKVQKSPAIFNDEKLNWFNREYIKKLSMQEFWTLGHVFLPMWIENIPPTHEMLKKIEHLFRDRIDKFSDIGLLLSTDDATDRGAAEFDYFFKEPIVDHKMLVWKTLKDDAEGLQKTKDYLRKALELLQTISDEDWNIDSIKNTLTPYAEQEGKGNVLWPLRVSLSGKEKSPDPFELAGILGKEVTLARIQAVQHL